MNADSICTVPSNKYHYLQRRESLSKSHAMKRLVGYWLSHKERFDALYENVDSCSQRKLLEYCAKAVARMWAYYDSCTEEDRIHNQKVIHDMNVFAKNRLPLFGLKEWELKLRAEVFFSHFDGGISFHTACILNRLFTTEASELVSGK